jgi:hypothetical protein
MVLVNDGGLELRWVALSVFIALLLLCPALFIQVEGTTDSLTVILTYPDIDYNIGDEITAQAHIFREGARIDPDTIIFTAGVNYDRYPMSRSSEGLWEGTVQITKERIYHHHSFPIEVKVTADTPEHEWDFDSHLVFVSNIPHLHVNIYLDDNADQLPSEGDQVDFTVTVSHGDKFMDPDPGTLRVWVTAENHDFYENLTVVRRSDGIYDGTFTVPSDIRTDIYLRMWAKAYFTGDIETEDDLSVADMYLRRYTIWVQYIDSDDTKANCEILVRDLEGTPVANAPITLNLTYRDTEDELVVISSNLTTGPHGIAQLEVPMEGISPHSWGVAVLGEISINGYVQRLYFSVPNPGYIGEPERNIDGFRVNLQNDQPIPAGTSVSLRFNATYDGTPLADTEVDSYLSWDHSVLFNGTMTTDDEGEFVIDLDTPDVIHEGWWRDRFHGQFKANTQTRLNNSWQIYEFSYFDSNRDYHNWRYSDYTLDLVQTGERTYQFSLRSPGLDGVGENVEASWSVRGYSEYPSTYPMWQSGGYYDSLHLEADWAGDAWIGTVELPSMIPEDTTFNLAASITHIDVPHSERISVSIINSTAYRNNEPPTVNITGPISGETVEGSFQINGTASDDSAVTLVEVRIDNGTWTIVAGTDDWELEILADELDEGMHTIQARSFDGTKRSAIEMVEFNFIRVQHSTVVSWSNLVVIISFIIIIVCAIMIIRKQSTR